MEFGQIEAFVQVVRDGSFTKAAETLNLTQPTISARLAVLEAELGCQLFVRGGRRLSLTPVGEAFRPYAERTLLALQEGEQAVRDYQAGRRGYVSIVALDTLAMSLLPKPVQRFRAAYPDVDLTVHLNMPRQILQMVFGGETQLGLIRGPLWDRGVEVVARFQEPVQVIANAGHPLAQKKHISLADILDYPIYRLPLDAATVAFVDHLVTQARSQSNQSQIWLPAIMVIPMLLKEQGVAFLPGSFVEDYLISGELVALDVADLPFLKHEPLLVKLDGYKLDSHHQELIRMIRAQWRKLEVTQ
ncbi:MAG: LysR family transcriptional regulator [Anaerolineales bacterium]